MNRSLRLMLYQRIWQRRMRGYPTVLACSGYSARYVERLWNRTAEVVYPPTAGRVANGNKRNVIASLGRFITTDRKNLRAQIRALPGFLDGVADAWELCMIGFCSEFPGDREFVEELRERGRELPASFLVNAERGRVGETLREAKIFWHTAGLPDGAEVPPRYREHFGIATVEAMRAGCVPIVPDAGGQPEIVRHGESGFLCRNVEDLIRFSVEVARDERLRERIGDQAIRRSLDFAPEVFEERIRDCVARALRMGRTRGATSEG